MGNEIERKWLVDNLPEGLKSYLSKIVIQGYLPVLYPDNEEARVRRSGVDTFLTLKGEGGLERIEAEIRLTGSLFEKLFPLTTGRVEKLRYIIPDGDRPLELDIFMGSGLEGFTNLSGLAMIEREFNTKEEAMAYQAKPWFGREVTDDKRYKNKNLARNGVPKD